MRIKVVRELITNSILGERDRCARIAEKHGYRVIADEIRSARPPQITVVRPETIAANPGLATPDTIIAGEGLVGDDIVRGTASMFRRDS